MAGAAFGQIFVAGILMTGFAAFMPCILKRGNRISRFLIMAGIAFFNSLTFCIGYLFAICILSMMTNATFIFFLMLGVRKGDWLFSAEMKFRRPLVGRHADTCQAGDAQKSHGHPIDKYLFHVSSPSC
jgi:hypothetical protein